MIIKRTLVIGDIHGAYKALEQVLDRAKVTKDDTLIFLGDYVDGWSQSYEVIEKLIDLQKTNNCVFILGNHDEWFVEYVKTGFHGSQWQQGANATKDSYGRCCSMMIPESHEKFFKSLVNYYKDDNNNIFVHGGFNRHFLLKEQTVPYIYYWDRDLWMQSLSVNNLIKQEKDLLDLNQRIIKFNIKEPCKEIFIGHTSTVNWKTDKPMNAANVWNLDTGAGFNGKLTIMDIDDKQYWQSDLVKELYSKEKGRN